MLLAIVVPFYKIIFFEKTLTSIANQTNKNFNLYIFDDNSPNDPTDILNKFRDKLSFRYKKFDSNLGEISLAAHWNRCLQFIEQESWINILCDDDVISPNFISEFYNSLPTLTKHNINIIRFSTLIIDGKDNTISSQFMHPEIQSSLEFVLNKLSNQTRSSLSEYIFNSSQSKNFRFHEYPLAWYSDDRALLEFSNFGPIYTNNKGLLKFRLSNYNISNSSYKMDVKVRAHWKFLNYLMLQKKSFLNKNQKKFIELEVLRVVSNINNFSFLEFIYNFSIYLINFKLKLAKHLTWVYVKKNNA